MTENNPRYVIDIETATARGRSLELLLKSRRCPSCTRRLEEEAAVPSVREHLKDIARCCARQEGFLSPNLSLLELVFRILLSERNRPMPLEELHQALSRAWSNPSNPRRITPEGLRRVLLREDYYGIRELPQDAQQGPSGGPRSPGTGP